MRVAFATVAALVVCAGSAQAQVELFRNGEYVTEFGTGPLGENASRIQPRFNSFGSTAANATFRIADNFRVPNGKKWQLTKTEWFVYQTSSATSTPATPIAAPTITQAFVTVFRGNPASGGVAVAGDFTTNRIILGETALDNCLRITETGAVTQERSVQRIAIDLSFLPELEAGEYWVAVGFTGTITPASGPFAPPVVPTRPATDNAVQQTVATGVWAPASGNGGTIDSGGNQDYPFRVFGVENDSTTNTNPYGSQMPNNLNLRQGKPAKIRVQTVAGSNPTSTGVTVTADLTGIGFGASETLYDDGTNGDDVAADGVYTLLTANIPNTTTLGTKTMACTVADGQARSSTFNLVYILNANSVEIEPNGLKFAPTPIPLSPGDQVTGTLANTATADTDYFLVSTPAPLTPGIVRYRLTLEGGANIANITLNLHTTAQANSIINPNGNVIFSAPVTVGTTKTLQWYGHGGAAEHKVYVRVLGVANGGSVPYTMTLTADPVTPTDIAGGNLAAGTLVFDFNNQGHTSNTEIWVYDSTYTPIADCGNDNDILTGGTQSRLEREFVDGTYYAAVSNQNMANNLRSPLDDSSRSLSVFDFPGVTGNGSTTANLNCGFSVTAGTDVRTVATTKDNAFDVNWFKFTVGASGPTACSPADVATEGSPQPFIDGPDGFITGTDFDVFVQAFFQEIRRPAPSGPYIADLTDDTGTGGPDTFITGADFDFFITKFFIGCP
ncbi:MAG: hypothetical protein JNJ48_04500 [Phycisphaerae bacterium]|nr:hypothetical protein [Phycisphaerae bacterium]